MLSRVRGVVLRGPIHRMVRFWKNNSGSSKKRRRRIQWFDKASWFFRLQIMFLSKDTLYLGTFPRRTVATKCHDISEGLRTIGRSPIQASQETVQPPLFSVKRAY